MENQNQEVLDISGSAPPAVDPAVAMHQMAKARVEVVEAMRVMAVQCTYPQDWVDYGGNPGVDGPAAERIARAFGLRSRNMKGPRKEFREDKDGKFYLIIVEGEVGFGEEYIWVMGTCDSRKPFFAKRDGKILPQEEVDENNIAKNALTNWWVNAVTRFLGLRGLTWEQLGEMSKGKITKAGAQQIDYGSKSVERDEKESSVADEIWTMLMEINGNVVKKAKEQMQKLTAFNDFKGYNDIKKVSPKMLPKLHKKVSESYKKWTSDSEGSAGTGIKTENKLATYKPDAATEAAAKKVWATLAKLNKLNPSYNKKWVVNEMGKVGFTTFEEADIDTINAFHKNVMVPELNSLGDTP